MNKQTYISELRRHFDTDERRINHALKVLNFAEQIMHGEMVDDSLRRIVTITAILHDVGIKAAEQKYGSSAGPYQEQEGPAIAEAIMRRLNESKDVIARVSYIIGGHHTPAKNNGLDFQIIWEADLMVNIEEDNLTGDKAKLAAIVAKNFRTKTGRQLAEQTYLA